MFSGLTRLFSDIKTKDKIFLLVNIEKELSLFCSLKNKIYFFKKKKNLDEKPAFFYKEERQIFDKVPDFQIFFSFWKANINIKMIQKLFEKFQKLRILFFLSNESILRKSEIFNKNFNGFLDSFYISLLTKKKIYLNVNQAKKPGGVDIIRLKKKKKIPIVLLPRKVCILRFFFLRKTKNLGKLIGLRIFIQYIKKSKALELNKKRTYKHEVANWGDIAQRFFEECGFLSVKFGSFEKNEIILLLNQF